MTGYAGINLRDILLDKTLGEDAAKDILSAFHCPLNPDVEHFLKHTAIEFSKQNIASTHLVMASYKGKYVLAGYFTLANKVFCIDKGGIPNSKWRSRLAKFGTFDKDLRRYVLSAPLIGQIGKNYADSYNKLITGDELLYLAIQKVRQMQCIVGGKIVYLECEDKEVLKDFYSRNGFVNFGLRELDRDETGLSGHALVQMLKYLD